MRGGVTVDDPGGRQRVASQDFIEAVPSEPARSVQVYAALSPRDDVVPAKDRFLTV
jgi:hypothetical protein